MARRLGATGMKLLVIDTGTSCLALPGTGSLCWPCRHRRSCGLSSIGISACASAFRVGVFTCSTPACLPDPAESRYLSRGFAKEIAAAAGGRYHRLPNAVDATSAIAAAAGAAVGEMKL